MAGDDSVSLILIALALAAVIVAAALLVDWRGALGRELPFWSFMRLRGTAREALVLRIGERRLRLAEMRCEACDSSEECAQRVATGTASPVADCPNAELFAQPSGLAKESRSDGLKPAA